MSTDEQDVSMQLLDLRRYADQRGFEIVEEYIDQGVSGSKVSRPALDRLMSDARKRKFDILMVWRFDRFARSTRMLVLALGEFRSLAIDFISYQENLDTSSPMGEAMFTIISALSQLERDVIRSRVKSGLKAAKARGKVLGRKKTRDDDAIRRLRSEGLSYSEIQKRLGVSKGAVCRALQSTPKTSSKST